MFENKNSKDLVLNLTYRPPNGDHKELENYFKISLARSLSLSLSLSLEKQNSHKDIILVGDFNMNLLDFDANKKVLNVNFL